MPLPVILSGAQRSRRIRVSKGVFMTYYVYIMASTTNYTVYIGVTNDLIRRVYEHKNHADPESFTSLYDVNKLVYFEQTTDVSAALEREKQLKG